MERFFDLRNEGGPLRVDGASVRRARWAAGLTQAQLARRIDLLGYYLPQPYISKLEHGEYRWGFTERMVTALAAALGIAVSEITGRRPLTMADAERIGELVRQLDEVIESSTRPGAQSHTA